MAQGWRRIPAYRRTEYARHAAEARWKGHELPSVSTPGEPSPAGPQATQVVPSGGPFQPPSQAQVARRIALRVGKVALGTTLGMAAGYALTRKVAAPLYQRIGRYVWGAGVKVPMHLRYTGPKGGVRDVYTVARVIGEPVQAARTVNVSSLGNTLKQLRQRPTVSNLRQAATALHTEFTDSVRHAFAPVGTPEYIRFRGLGNMEKTQEIVQKLESMKYLGPQPQDVLGNDAGRFIYRRPMMETFAQNLTKGKYVPRRGKPITTNLPGAALIAGSAAGGVVGAGMADKDVAKQTRRYVRRGYTAALGEAQSAFRRVVHHGIVSPFVEALVGQFKPV